MRTRAAALSGLGLIVIGTGLLGSDLRAVVGLTILGYSVTVLMSLALRDAKGHLAELFDAWVAWEPAQPRYGRPELYLKNRSTNQLQTGQGLIEYALILSLVVMVVMVALVIMGPAIGNMFSNVVSNI